MDKHATPLTAVGCTRLVSRYFEQFCFYKQWFQLKKCANGLGISIMGDIPIYVNFDSVDVHQNPQVFKLNDEGQQDVVAGVLPLCLS